jgi:hypothetical protein
MISARGVLAALACSLLAAGCASPTNPTTDTRGSGASLGTDQGTAAASCGSLFDRIIGRERSDDTAGAIDAELDALGDHCPSDYQVFVDYVSIKGFAESGAGGTCSEYRAYGVEPAAIQLAQNDGYCSTSGPGRGDAGSPGWTCSYQPTYNDDWHDDVACSNGTEQRRPYLRGWDSFVTEAEIMEAANEVEQQLNRGERP